MSNFFYYYIMIGLVQVGARSLQLIWGGETVKDEWLELVHKNYPYLTPLMENCILILGLLLNAVLWPIVLIIDVIAFIKYTGGI